MLSTLARLAYERLGAGRDWPRRYATLTRQDEASITGVFYYIFVTPDGRRLRWAIKSVMSRSFCATLAAYYYERSVMMTSYDIFYSRRPHTTPDELEALPRPDAPMV